MSNHNRAGSDQKSSRRKFVSGARFPPCPGERPGDRKKGQAEEVGGEEGKKRMLMQHGQRLQTALHGTIVSNTVKQ